MIFRQMDISDYDDAFRLWHETEGVGLRSLDDSRGGIERFLERNPGTSFICRNGKKLIGTILCGHDGRRAYIYHAVVHPDYRKHGIGTKLVECITTALKKEKITKAALIVYTDNTAGNEFWEKCGFTERNDLIYRNLSIDENNV